eukprot:scaffold149_cov315-Pinguiococcus_pyrenoidosus.AAC.24
MTSSRTSETFARKKRASRFNVGGGLFALRHLAVCVWRLPVRHLSNQVGDIGRGTPAHLLVAYPHQAGDGRGRDDPGHGLEHREEGGAAGADREHLSLPAVPLSVRAHPVVPVAVERFLDLVPELVEIVVHVAEVGVVAIEEVVVVEQFHREVRRADGAAVVAVGAHGADVRASRVVAGVVKVKLARVVAGVCGRHDASAVGAVRARLAQHGRASAGVVFLVVQPFLAVVEVVVLAGEEHVHVVLVAVAVVGPVARVVAHGLVAVRIDQGHGDRLGEEEHAGAVVDAADRHLHRLVRAGTGPGAVGLEHHAQVDKVLHGDLVRVRTGGRQLDGRVPVGAHEASLQVEDLGVRGVHVLHAQNVDAGLRVHARDRHAIRPAELDAVDGLRHQEHGLRGFRRPALAVVQRQHDLGVAHAARAEHVRLHLVELDLRDGIWELLSEDGQLRRGGVQALIIAALLDVEAGLWVRPVVGHDLRHLHIHVDGAGPRVDLGHQQRARLGSPCALHQMHRELLVRLHGEVVAELVQLRLELQLGGAVLHAHEALTADAEGMALGLAHLRRVGLDAGSAEQLAHDGAFNAVAHGLHLALAVGHRRDAQVARQGTLVDAPGPAVQKPQHQAVLRGRFAVHLEVHALHDLAEEAHLELLVRVGGEVGAADL